MSEQWYYRQQGRDCGPVSEEQLRSLIDEGTLTATDQVRRGHDQTWHTAEILQANSATSRSEATTSPTSEAPADEAAEIDLDAMLAQPTAAPEQADATADEPQSLDLDAMLQPSASAPGKKPISDDWYYRISGQRFGPLDFDTLFERAAAGEFSRYDEVLAPGSDEWVEAQAIVGLFSDPEEDLESMIVDEQPLPETAAPRAPRVKPQWYYRVLNQELGPVDFEDLFDLVVEGNLRPDDEIRESHASEWQRADSLVGLFPEEQPSEPAIAEDLLGDESDEDAEWYFQLEGQELGPVTFERLMQLAETGRLQPGDPIRQTRLGNWIDAESMVGLFPEETGQSADETPEPEPVASSVPDRPEGDADDWAAALLSEPAPPAAASPAVAPEIDSPPEEATPPAPAVTPPPSPVTAPSAAAPVSRPAFAPPPPKTKKKSSSGGGFSLPSGMGDMLTNPKVLGGLGAVVLIAGLSFVPWGKVFAPNANDLVARVDDVWGKVKTLYDNKAADAEWDTLASQATPTLQEIAKEAEERGAGSSQPELQIVLLLTRDHIPKVLSSKTETTEIRIKTVENFLSRAKTE